MARIVLATLNAKYIHPALGLRYLLANVGPLKNSARLLEFDIKKKPSDVAQAILDLKPDVVGLGVYIWNVKPLTQVVSLLKQLRPEIMIVLGGPEIKDEADLPALCESADYLVIGEGETAFADLCSQVASGNETEARGQRPAARVIKAEHVDVNQLAFPYDLYSEHDLSTRMTYVETSRGCPYECEYCVSAHDAPVRYFDLDPLFAEFDRLLARGARKFKFVDRTFNINTDRCLSVLDFFLDRLMPGLFLHFEMAPDLFPERLREIVTRFPEETLQFEIGIQSFNEEVLRRIRRMQDNQKAEENLRFLRNQTRVFIHADLIAGLPGESLESFAVGFDRLLALRPQEIQVGILKRLRGTAIGRHDAEWKMVYNSEPPYEIISNSSMDQATLDRIKRFARFWDMLYNSGNFIETMPMLTNKAPSSFEAFMGLSDRLYCHFGRDHTIALVELMEQLCKYLIEVRGYNPTVVAQTLLRDYKRKGRRDTPVFLRPVLKPAS